MAAICGAVLLAAACSDDGGEEQSESYADAIAERFDPTPDRPTGQVGRCFAEQVVEYLGAERLVALGSPDEVAMLLVDDEAALGLTAAEADDIAEEFVDCGPDISRGVAADLLDDYGVDQIEQPGCLAAAGRPLAVAFFATAFGGDASAPTAFSTSEAAMIAGDLMGCGDRLAADMREWMVPRLELGPQFMGGDAPLDDQQHSCVAGEIDDATLERFLAGELAGTNSSIDTLFATDPEVFGPVASAIAACF